MLSFPHENGVDFVANIQITGAPYSGKSEIIEGLADRVPDSFSDAEHELLLRIAKEDCTKRWTYQKVGNVIVPIVLMADNDTDRASFDTVPTWRQAVAGSPDFSPDTAPQYEQNAIWDYLTSFARTATFAAKIARVAQPERTNTLSVIVSDQAPFARYTLADLTLGKSVIDPFMPVPDDPQAAGLERRADGSVSLGERLAMFESDVDVTLLANAGDIPSSKTGLNDDELSVRARADFVLQDRYVDVHGKGHLRVLNGNASERCKQLLTVVKPLFMEQLIMPTYKSSDVSTAG